MVSTHNMKFGNSTQEKVNSEVCWAVQGTQANRLGSLRPGVTGTRRDSPSFPCWFTEGIL